MKKNNIILIILCYLFLSVLVDYSANAQTNKPTIVFQIDNEIIGDDSFVVEIKKNSLFKTKLVLKSTQKTIKVNIPNDVISNTDSIKIRTFRRAKANVVNIVDVYVCYDQPVYHCFQCQDCYQEVTTIYLYKSCEQLGGE